MAEISKSETTIKTTKYTLYPEDIKKILDLEENEVVHSIHFQEGEDRRSAYTPEKLIIFTEKEVKEKSEAQQQTPHTKK